MLIRGLLFNQTIVFKKNPAINKATVEGTQQTQGKLELSVNQSIVDQPTGLSSNSLSIRKDVPNERRLQSPR